MLRFCVLFSSIFLTALSAWSDEHHHLISSDSGNQAPEIELIDARNMSPEVLEKTIKYSTSLATKEYSAVDLVRKDLESQGMGLKVKQFIVLQEDPYNQQDYSATLVAASYVSESYAEADKRKHAQWGYGIGLASTVALNNSLRGVFTPKVANIISRALGTLTACAVGKGKESLYDKGRSNHTVDDRDFYATCAGGASMALGQVNFAF